MITQYTPYTVYKPTEIQIDNIGIGLGEDSISDLNIHSNEYLLVGESTNNAYSTIINNNGLFINTTRDKARSEIGYGLYVDDDVYVTGKVYANGGIVLNNIVLHDEITSEKLTELITTVNQNTIPIYNGYDSTNIDNIYTTSFLTLGNLTGTYDNHHSLNIIQNANHAIDNIQVSIKNNSREAALQFGFVGDANISPAIIRTSPNVPLEFHISRASDVIDNSYDITTGLPKYDELPQSNIPSMVLDKNGSLCLGAPESFEETFNVYSKDGRKTIVTENTCNMVMNIKGPAFIEDIITFDYYQQKNLHLDDVYIRQGGLTLSPNQIRSGTFNSGNFAFSSNLTVGQNIDQHSLTVDGELAVNGIGKFQNDVIFDKLTEFNHITQFNSDILMGKDTRVKVENMDVNEELNIIGSLMYNDKRLNVVDVNQTVVNQTLSLGAIKSYFPTSVSIDAADYISQKIIEHMEVHDTTDILDIIKQANEEVRATIDEADYITDSNILKDIAISILASK
jgi:hypothetical protein